MYTTVVLQGPVAVRIAKIDRCTAGNSLIALLLTPVWIANGRRKNCAAEK